MEAQGWRGVHMLYSILISTHTRTHRNHRRKLSLHEGEGCWERLPEGYVGRWVVSADGAFSEWQPLGSVMNAARNLERVDDRIS